jgi:hypothetical protein
MKHPHAHGENIYCCKKFLDIELGGFLGLFTNGCLWAPNVSEKKCDGACKA